MRKHGQIRIELLSDLVCGSGYSYAGIIDSDICYDELGLPYIPARRLKGCMRETAESVLYELISTEDVLALFGNTRQQAGDRIILDNARLEGYEEMACALRAAQREKRVTTQEVLDQYTSVYGQTAMEEGVAKTGSLRFTRALRQYDPLMERKRLVFLADITFPSEKEETLRQILQGTRHIGEKRNRGFGSIVCTLGPCTEVSEGQFESVKGVSLSGRIVRIDYSLVNISPLMLSEASDNESVRYVRGQRVLGALAGAYLRNPESSPEDQAFYDLFLNGKTIFSDLRPQKDGKIFYPAPLYLGRLKKTDVLVNTMFSYQKNESTVSDGEEQDPYDPEGGNLPKKLRTSFARISGQEASVLDVRMDLVYHHSKKGTGKDGTPGILYSHEAIAAHQAFGGFILVPEEYADFLVKLLKKADLRFGKSLTAQYGKCRIEEDVKKSKSSDSLEEAMDDQAGDPSGNSDCNYLKDEYIAVTLLSDGIFHNGMDYTIECGQVHGIIAQALTGEERGKGLSWIGADISQPVSEEAGDNENLSSMIKTGILHGFQSKWNLRRQPLPVVKAGSVFLYRLEEPLMLRKSFVGERNLEGFGQIRIDRLTNMGYVVKKIEETEEPDKPAEGTVNKTAADILIERIERKRFLQEEKRTAVMKAPDLTADVSASTIGRVTLMLKESLAEAKREDGDKEEALEAFKARLNSIRRQEVKEFAKRLKEEISDFQKRNEENGISDEWDQYLMTILIVAKYAKAGRENE